jgi:hypothetical protein
MKPPRTGRTVYYTRDADTQLTATERAELATLKRRPIDLSDIPEMTIDQTWVMTGAGDCLGLALERARREQRTTASAQEKAPA